MRRIGIADAEFTAPTGTGKVHMYTTPKDGEPIYYLGLTLKAQELVAAAASQDGELDITAVVRPYRRASLKATPVPARSRA